MGRRSCCRARSTRRRLAAEPGGYAGQYQQQVIALRNERLYYTSAVSPESSLTLIAEDLFEVDADPTLRIRFVGDGAGPAAKLIGLCSDGTLDEWARSQ